MILLCPCADSPPRPSSFKSKKRAAASSEESEAFRKCFANLIKEVQDLELFTLELYSNNVISKVDGMSVAGPSVTRRRMRLFTAVGDQIAVNPAKFKGKKVCHHSELHSFIVDPTQEEEGLVSTFIKLAAFRMNFPTTNHIVQKNLQLQHQKTGWGIGWGIGYINMMTQQCAQSWQLVFTVNHKF